MVQYCTVCAVHVQCTVLAVHVQHMGHSTMNHVFPSNGAKGRLVYPCMYNCTRVQCIGHSVQCTVLMILLDMGCYDTFNILLYKGRQGNVELSLKEPN